MQGVTVTFKSVSNFSDPLPCIVRSQNQGSQRTFWRVAEQWGNEEKKERGTLCDRFNLGSKKMTHGTHLENSLDASNGKKGTFANSEDE